MRPAIPGVPRRPPAFNRPDARALAALACHQPGCVSAEEPLKLADSQLEPVKEYSKLGVDGSL